MIFIKKSTAPQELEELKKIAEMQGLSDKEGYDLLRNPLKRQVRNALVQDQGHLCAYCMRKIPDDRITQDDVDFSDIYIEHWIPRSTKRIGLENKGLDYNNMLAVCSGNEKAPEAKGKKKKRFLTCDKKRGDAILKVNPMDEKTLETIYYTADGLIKSSDKTIDEDLNVRLNLNCDSDAVTLPQSRKAVLDEIQNIVFQEEDHLLDACKEQLHIWEMEEDPKTPFIGIAINWLKEQIMQLSEE